MGNDKDIEIMNCLDVCRQLSSDAYSDNNVIKTHLASCESCSAYATQQNKLTHSLEQAVNVTVPEGLASRILLTQSLNDKKQYSSNKKRLYAIAASILLSVGLISSFIFVEPSVSLDQVALKHVKDELHHLHDNKNIQLAKLNSVLKPFNMKFNSSPGKINYASSCIIRNSKGVHIIVQTKTGPVTILLMPGEFVKNRKLVNDTLFSGSVVPIDNGSFAIIGDNQESLAELEEKIKNDITYL